MPFEDGGAPIKLPNFLYGRRDHDAALVVPTASLLRQPGPTPTAWCGRQEFGSADAEPLGESALRNQLYLDVPRRICPSMMSFVNFAERRAAGPGPIRRRRSYCSSLRGFVTP